MNRNFIILGIIGSILVLCQWFVFLSLRKYLCQNREGIQRRIAYPVLILFGLITTVAARLEFGSEMFSRNIYSAISVCNSLFIHGMGPYTHSGLSFLWNDQLINQTEECFGSINSDKVADRLLERQAERLPRFFLC